MRQVKIADGSFRGLNSFSCAGENAGFKPDKIEWDRIEKWGANTKVFTDSKLLEAVGDVSTRRIALLLEPPAIRPGIYQQAWELRREFFAILTHQRDWVARDGRYRWYPYGGSWIRPEDWGLKPKTKQASLIVSQKVGQEGHRLRHRAKELHGVDCYGRGVGNWVESKVTALADYRYSIVIENSKSDLYFTEKLIDCMSQGTIPIYWGPDLSGLFNPWGIIRFDAFAELPHILGRLGSHDYMDRWEAVQENYTLAQSYRCPEDWICWRYPGLLDG